jgi:Bacterial Ig-like domain (group 1)
MKTLMRLFSLLAVLAIVGCSGGGGSAGSSPFGPGAGGGTGGGGGGSGSTSPVISVAINPSTVTAAAPGAVRATVTTASGVGVPGQVVQFSSQSGLGSFSAQSALTDENGVASVTVKPTNASTAGADLVLASTTVGTNKLTAQAGFQLTATNVTIASFTSDVGAGALAPYGTTVLTVALSAGAQGTPVSVAVSSACVTAGQASLVPASATTSTGTATFTYRDNGCGATGKDTLQASVTGTTSTSPLQLTLTSPTVASIAFVSASPATIYLQGSGYVENSNVTFQVRDAAGNGVRGQTVLINPTTLAGGLLVGGAGNASQFPLSATSDANGNVIVRVNSGTVPTPVRIRASISVNGTQISTVSSTLAIAVGLPSELNFSMSQRQINIEGYNRDGTANSYTLIASDRLGNPVPDGTAINFVTEGGQIQSIAFSATANGLSSATAQFQSSQPRPADGRITVLAYALGEKSFIDENGDNVFTAADTNQWFQDLGYPYLDTLYNGQYTSSPNNQFIVQTPTGSAVCNPTAKPPSLGLDVSIPTRPNTCSGTWGGGYVRRAVETIFSTSSAFPSWGTSSFPGAAAPSGACPAGLSLIRPNSGASFPAYDATGTAQRRVYYPFGSAGLYGVSKVGVLSFLASDANPVAFNPVAAGSVISVTATTGLTATVAGGSPVPSSSAPTGVAVSYSFADGVTSGTITVSIVSPSGLGTAVSQSLSTGALPAGYSFCP